MLDFFFFEKENSKIFPHIDIVWEPGFLWREHCENICVQVELASVLLKAVRAFRQLTTEEGPHPRVLHTTKVWNRKAQT